MTMHISGIDGASFRSIAVWFHGGRIECVALSREGDVLFSNNHTTEEDIAECRSLLENVRWPPEGIDLHRTYIRFGALPKDGYSRNHASDESKSGVSAFECMWDPCKGTWHIAGSAVVGAALLGNMLDHHVYLLYGDRVGTGSDGEPVLENPQVIEELSAVSESPFCLDYVQSDVSAEKGSLRS